LIQSKFGQCSITATRTKLQMIILVRLHSLMDSKKLINHLLCQTCKDQHLEVIDNFYQTSTWHRLAFRATSMMQILKFRNHCCSWMTSRLTIILTARFCPPSIISLISLAHVPLKLQYLRITHHGNHSKHASTLRLLKLHFVFDAL
jgi:hypothetical protein